MQCTTKSHCLRSTGFSKKFKELLVFDKGFEISSDVDQFLCISWRPNPTKAFMAGIAKVSISQPLRVVKAGQTTFLYVS